MIKQFYFLLAFTWIFCIYNANAQERRYVKEAGTGDGTSWENASGDIQAMIIDLSTNHESGEVWVASGTYVPQHKVAEQDKDGAATTELDRAFVLAKNISLYGGFAGYETSLEERDWKSNVSILSGVLNDADKCYHIVISAGDIGSAWIDGFTITGGDAKAGGKAAKPSVIVNEYEITRGDGGGIYVIGSSPILSNLTVVGNLSATMGGGIYLYESSSIMTDLIVSGNHSGYEGGGILTDMSSAVLLNSLLFENSTLLGGGGMCNNNSNVLLTNITFLNNMQWYAGLRNQNCTVIATNLLVAGHSSEMLAAGIGDWNSTSYYTNITVTNNTGKVHGLGTNAISGSKQYFRNSIIYGNKDAVSAYIVPDAMENDEKAIASFENCLIGGYKPDDGENKGNLDGSIVWEQGVIKSEANNPKFKDPTNNDYRLLNESPCLGKGNIGFYATDATPNISDVITDVDGLPRYFNGSVDMGSYQNNYLNTEIYFIKINGTQATLKQESNTDYEVSISKTDKAIIMAEAAYSKATVSGDIGEKSVQIGKNDFVIKVTAEDGKTVTNYNLKVTVSPLSDDASLASITVNGTAATLKYGNENVYEITIANTETVTIAAQTKDIAATVTGDIGEKAVTTGINEFSITVTAEDGKTEKRYQLEVTVSTVGINDNAQEIFVLYPNPANDLINIRSTAPVHHISIYDMQGKLVRDIPLSTNTINVAGLRPGIYLIKAASSEGLTMHKVIKR